MKMKLIDLLSEKFPELEQKVLEAIIMNHMVLVDDEIVAKKGTRISKDAAIRLKKKALKKYITRAQIKLDHAIDEFNIDIKGKKVLDIGASEGGFTKCLLERGAESVYAVDVAYGIFNWDLRNDDRVVVLERKNAKSLTVEDVDGTADIIAVDVSFLSLTSLFSIFHTLLKAEGVLMCLVKPQFESSKDTTKGIILDSRIHAKILLRIVSKSEEAGFQAIAVTPSPILGRKGNKEFFVKFVKSSNPGLVSKSDILKILEEPETV